MNRCTAKLFAASFTFFIGIITVFSYQFLNTPLLTTLPSNSVQTPTNCYFSDVDVRLMEALRRVQLKNLETDIKRMDITTEQTEKFRAYADSPQLTKSLKKDIKNTNDGCDRDGLTAKQCNLRKEAAIRDIWLYTTESPYCKIEARFCKLPACL